MSELVLHLFLVNEMGSLVDKVHEVIEVVGPRVEDVVGILVGHEVDDAS